MDSEEAKESPTTATSSAVRSAAQAAAAGSRERDAAVGGRIQSEFVDFCRSVLHECMRQEKSPMLHAYLFLHRLLQVRL